MGASSSQTSMADAITTDRLMERLTSEFATYCFSKAELSSLRRVFQEHCDTEGSIQYWSESTFTNLLGRPFPPSFKPLVAAGRTLFTSAIFHAAFPFKPTGPAVMTFEGLLRAFSMLTRRQDRVLGKGERFTAAGSRVEHIVRRPRTETDRRRVLFQSLADRIAAQGASANNDTDRESSLAKDGSLVVNMSADEPEDEGSEHVLDVIAATRHKELQKLVSPTRESLRPLVAMLPRSQANLGSLQIPRERFRALIGLLLCMQLGDPGEDAQDYFAHLPDLEVVSRRIIGAFPESEEQGITWPVFEEAIETSLPNIFVGLPSLFELLLETKVSIPRAGSMLPSEGKILTLPILSQVSTFLPTNVYFTDLRCLYTSNIAGFNTRIFSDRALLWHSQSMLLVTGTRVPNDNSPPEDQSLPSQHVIFGAYFPAKWQQRQDEEHLKTNSVLPFQLDPVHTVFCPRTTEPLDAVVSVIDNIGGNIGVGVADPDKLDEPVSGLLAAPVRMALDLNLRSGIFEYEAGGGGGGSNITRLRTDWKEHLTLDALELWGFGDPFQDRD